MRDCGPPLLLGGALALVPFSTCALKLATGVPCPLCGFTRASLALLRGDVARAEAFHPLVVPLVVLFVVACVLACFARDSRWAAFVRFVLPASGIVLIGVWIARFLGVFGGPVAG